MKTIMKTSRHHIFYFILMTFCGLLSTAHAQDGHHADHCALSPHKAQSMTKEQRDEERMSCLKRKGPQLALKQCLHIAQEMEYSTNADEARSLCLDNVADSLTIAQCSMTAKAMEYADNADDVLWVCIQHFGPKLSKNQCLGFAHRMNYPANQERSVYYCTDEL